MTAELDKKRENEKGLYWSANVYTPYSVTKNIVILMLCACLLKKKLIPSR